MLRSRRCYSFLWILQDGDVKDCLRDVLVIDSEKSDFFLGPVYVLVLEGTGREPCDVGTGGSPAKVERNVEIWSQ